MNSGKMLAKKYRDHRIDVLVNNAGVLGDPAVQTLQDFEYETFTQVMTVNVFGAMAVSRVFLKRVGASDQKKIVTITSSMGSLTLTRCGIFTSTGSARRACTWLCARYRRTCVTVGPSLPCSCRAVLW